MPAENKNANCPSPAVTPPDPIRILLAENQTLIRDALRPALQELEERVVLLECDSLNEAIRIADEAAPIALAILALRMPDMNGVDGIRGFHARFPNIPLAAISGCHRIGDIVRAFDFGAIGFLSKSTKVESIARAVGLMLTGQRFIPGEVMDAMQRNPPARPVMSGRAGDREDAPYPLHRLTERERQVLALLIEGKPNKAIAISLGVQEVTVKLHIRKLLRKLKVSNRTQAVTFALQSGWGPEI